jgi:hypothetical protein
MKLTAIIMRVQAFVEYVGLKKCGRLCRVCSLSLFTAAGQHHKDSCGLLPARVQRVLECRP